MTAETPVLKLPFAPIVCPHFDSKVRYIARFLPQVWQRDWAVEADPEGDTTFDVTAQMLAMTEQEREEIGDGGNEAADNLRDLPHAPAWIRNWNGPFEVYIDEIELDDEINPSTIIQPNFPDTLREFLIRVIANVMMSRLSNEETVKELYNAFIEGRVSLKSLSSTQLLERYQELIGRSFLDDAGLEVNAFGDVRSRLA